MKHYLAKFLFAPLIVILIYGIFFQNVLIGVLSKTFFYIDEVLLVLALFLVFFPLQKSTTYVKMVIGLFAMVVIFFALSFNAFSFRTEITILTQILMHFKAFFLFLLLYNFKDYINFKLIVHVLFALTIMGVLVNMMMGVSFITLIDAELQYRFGMVRPVGIQGSTGNLGITFAFIYLFYMFVSPKENYAKTMLLTLGFSFLFLFSSVRTPFVALMVAFAFIFGASIKKLLFGVVIVAALVPLFMNEYVSDLIILTIDDLATLSDPAEAQYIRGIMIYFSVVLAAEYFPFGTGAASYGTFLSDNSPVYQEIGLSTLYFFQEKWGIYDSNLASVLGEFGVIGFSIFCFFLYNMFRLIFNEGANRAFVLTFAILVGFYSMVAPIFMSSYGALMLALILVAAVPTKQSASGNQDQPSDDSIAVGDDLKIDSVEDTHISKDS